MLRYISTTNIYTYISKRILRLVANPQSAYELKNAQRKVSPNLTIHKTQGSELLVDLLVLEALCSI